MLPDALGVFTFRRVAAGTRYLAAWLDGNGNGVLDAGDHYAEYPAPVLVTAGQTTIVRLTLSPVTGIPVVSARFIAELGLD